MGSFAGLKTTEALKEMLVKTPAIIQSQVGESYYTRVNGGICIGSIHGTHYFADPAQTFQIDIRESKTFVSDDLLFDNQKMITKESIEKAIKGLGKDNLPDEDRRRRSVRVRVEQCQNHVRRPNQKTI
jgi:hypothetical protein